MNSKKKIIHNESSSLWNYAISPGWSVQEVDILKLALMKFGVGKWRKIINSQCLPGKTIAQIYMQTQRLLGQQSLGEFMGLHMNLQKVFLNNKAKTNVLRKYNFIINTGDNMTQEDRKKKIIENRKLFGLTQAEVNQIKLPQFKVSSSSTYLTLDEVICGKFTTIEKLIHLDNIRRDAKKKIDKIDRGEIKEGESFQIPNPIKKTKKITIEFQYIDGNYEIIK